MVTQTIRVNLNQKDLETIIAVQNDTLREIAFEFYASDAEGAVQLDPDEFTIKFNVLKPDNNFVMTTFTDGIIKLSDQITAVTGTGYYCILLMQDDDLIYSGNGKIIINDHVIGAENIDSVSEADGYTFPDDFYTKDTPLAVLDDSTTSTTSTWSSNKINGEINTASTSAIAQLNAMKTGFDRETYDTPAESVIGNDSKLSTRLGYVGNVNLFNSANATGNTRFDGTGNAIQDFTCFISDFIPVKEGMKYIRTGAEDTFHRLVYVCYPTISAWAGNNLLVTMDKETTAPAGAKYIIVSGLLSEMDTFTLYEETADDKVARAGVNTIIEKTDNLVDESSAVDGYINQYGEIEANPLYKTSDFIRITAGQKIIIHPSLRKFLAYHYNKIILDGSFIDANTADYVYTATVDGYIRFSYNVMYNGVIQANYGDSVATYEPYGYKIKDDIYFNNDDTKKLKAKTVYSFGDSLLYGHYSGVGMIDGLCSAENMVYTKYAVNGADILGGGIEGQVTNASATVPDFVVFDGLMNDTTNGEAYTTKLGELSDTFTGSELDTSKFYGAFEHLLYTLRTKYMTSNIIFVACHRTPSRTLTAQDTLQEAVRKCCEKWAIPYVDIYQDGQINCYIDSMRNTYSYNQQGETSGGNGTHLTGAGYDKWYAPIIKAKMLELLA